LIPLRIILKNFRAISHADIDLSSVTLAAVCGKNGAGKSSTFTLAPIFALFGDKIKGISTDDLVRRGTQEMAVTFEFEHQGSIYLVIRTRSTKGSGKSTLELQQQVNGKWESRSAEKIKDTEDVIRTLLNLDAETFTASSMILQGKANEFTAQTSGKRKDILQQILGLNIYDQLQAKARERASVLHLEIEKTKDQLLNLAEKLKVKPDKESLLIDYDQMKVSLHASMESKELELQQQEGIIRQLLTKADRAAELAKQSLSYLEEITALTHEKTGHTAKLERAQKIINNEPDILSKSAEYLQVKEQIAVLEARAPELERLQTEIESIETALSKVIQEQQPLVQRILDVEKLLANRELLAAKEHEYKESSADLAKTELIADQWDLLEKQLADIRAKADAEATRISTTERLLEADIKTLQAKTAMLDDSNCIDVTQAACHFLADAQEAKETLSEKKRVLAEIDRSVLETYRADNLVLETQQQSLGYDYAAHRALKNRVEQLRIFAEQASQLQAKEELLVSLREQQSHLMVQQEELMGKQARLKVELASLQEVFAPLPVLRERVTKLYAWAALKDELAAAQETKKNVDERIAAINKEVQQKTGRRDEAELERSVILLDTIQIDNLHLQVSAIKSELNTLKDQQMALAGQIGGLTSDLAALEKDEQIQKQLTAEMEPKAKQWSRYQTLIRAFGKDGIPALIIENAVPELERIANDILSQMSKGKHYIRFETQRELKSRDGITETLDIMIGDWTAERPYETFSGGEQLRIDYAIRFALAELLAQRAGSKVEWLTIDEGLGSQDGEHRGLVLEAIKSVADRFKKVLVITHIEEAQAVFDQLIHIQNDDESAEVNIA
jgi:exonuclease SbcC